MLASPNTEAMSQLLSLKKPSKYVFPSSKSDLDYFMQKYSQDSCWELGLAFCLTQLSIQVRLLTSKKCCHVDIHVILETLRLGTPWEVVSPNFHALNGWDCTDRPQVTWDLGLQNPLSSGPKLACHITSVWGNSRGDFLGIISVEILVFASPTGYM